MPLWTPHLWIPDTNLIADPALALTMMARTWAMRVPRATAAGGITFVGSAVANSIDGSNITLSLSSLTGLAQNDIVIACSCYTNNGTTTESMMEPTSNDYTLAALVQATDAGGLYAGYKLQGVSPDTSLTFTGSNAGAYRSSAACALAFRGVNQTTPLDVTPTTSTVTAPSSPDPPSITPTSNNCCIVAIGGSTSGTGDASPGSITDFLPSPVVTTFGDDNQDATIGAAYRILTGGSSVAQNPAAFSTWATTFAGLVAAITIALRPA